MPHFYKFSNNTRPAHGDMVLQEGLNVDPNEWREEGKGAIHFTTLADAFRHHERYTHVWDVEIPEDESLVNFHNHKVRAHSLILKNCRPKCDILRGIPAANQVRILKAIPRLSEFARVRGEALRAFAPTVVWDRYGVTHYDNGLTVTRLPEANSWRFMATTDCIIEPPGTVNDDFCVLDEGQVMFFNVIRDGLVEGMVETIVEDGSTWQCTYAHGVPHGECVHTNSKGEVVKRVQIDYGLRV